MPQVVGADAVDRADGAAEHVVAPAELAGALDGDDVLGLLDDADDRRVAARVAADAAHVASATLPQTLQKRTSFLTRSA